MSTTSLSLLERARNADDPQAWQRLAALYEPMLKRWLGRYEMQPSDVDDLTQDVLLTVASELRHFAHAGRAGAFRNWLKTILTYRLRNYWRKNRRQLLPAGGCDHTRDLQGLEDPESELSRLWDREHDQHVLEKLLDVVSARIQPAPMQIFLRVAIQGESAESVANELKISLNSVVIAKCRVLKELRREAKGLLDS